jgi:hypothetical protein
MKQEKKVHLNHTITYENSVKKIIIITIQFNFYCIANTHYIQFKKNNNTGFLIKKLPPLKSPRQDFSLLGRHN